MREKNYRHLEPKVIVEPILSDDTKDYKVFCHNGRAKVLQVDIDRFGEHYKVLFDNQGQRLDFSLDVPQLPDQFTFPKNGKEMFDVAEKLARYFPMCRIDLYYSDQIYVGEITQFHMSGHSKFFPPTSEAEFSRLLFTDE